jgi:hypothetical protein
MNSQKLVLLSSFAEPVIVRKLARGLSRVAPTKLAAETKRGRRGKARPFYEFSKATLLARTGRTLVFPDFLDLKSVLGTHLLGLIDSIGSEVRRHFHPRGKPRLVVANYTRFLGRQQQIAWHSDGDANRVAFVYYLKDVSSAGGGRLVMGRSKGRMVTEMMSLSPTENTLVLFGVPRVHRVEPLVGLEERCAISGWWTW